MVDIPRPSGLPQNSVIAAALFIGFLVYITIKGRLAAYINLFFGNATSNLTGTTANAAVPSGGMQPLPTTPALSPLKPLQPSTANSSSYITDIFNEPGIYGGNISGDRSYIDVNIGDSY